MSLPSQHTITCGGCGRRQAFTMWDSLNVSLNRDLKAELLRGELTRFVCAGCGWSGDVFYPMLYHDMEQKVMIHLCAPQGEPESLGSGGLPQMERFLEGYRFRRVNTRNELREKILIFDAGLDDGLLEWAEFTGNRYGTPRVPVAEHRSQGRPVLLEIEVQGARQVRLAVPDALLVFLEPPSWEVLTQRLVGRGTEDQATVARRLQAAQDELAAAVEFDRRLVNADVQETAQALVALALTPGQ